eukprot:TRINITY_DN21801_c0_g1_i1.p1 TRINITY_DN21801_c0_g1~~TRINITY_DN21801_c0_g1_i1.p1  ORF type:complete len:253 (-),score=4.84 TRINITY_DN21801_c0_g1_i1:462-1163(-)
MQNYNIPVFSCLNLNQLHKVSFCFPLTSQKLYFKNIMFIPSNFTKFIKKIKTIRNFYTFVRNINLHINITTLNSKIKNNFPIYLNNENIRTSQITESKNQLQTNNTYHLKFTKKCTKKISNSFRDLKILEQNNKYMVQVNCIVQYFSFRVLLQKLSTLKQRNIDKSRDYIFYFILTQDESRKIIRLLFYNNRLKHYTKYFTINKLQNTKYSQNFAQIKVKIIHLRQKYKISYE